MSELNRRAFLSRAVRASAGALAGTHLLSASPLQGSPTCCPHSGAVQRPSPPAKWQKHGIVLEATEDWEHGEVQNFTSPAEPIEGGRWRIWYSARGSRTTFTLAYAEGPPGGNMKKFPLERSAGRPGDGPFTMGHLPDGWNPTQVIHIHMRDGRHRIYFWAHGQGVLRYLAADSDDGRRYRVVNPHRPVLYHPHDRAAHGVASPDGVLLRREPSGDRPADEPLALPHLVSNDATTVYQLPDGTFEMYSVALVPVPRDDPAYIAHDNAPGLVRVIDRYVSEDGLHFENRLRVIDRDEHDPGDQQFYYLAVTCTPRGRVGMLGHYRVEAQTMDLEWCFSTDGLKWSRGRNAWLSRGDETQPDSYGIYAAHNLVERNGQHHLFYTAVNSAHNGRHSHGPPRSVIMHATIDSLMKNEK